MLEADVTCVVPARLGSTRFPRKLLQPLFGKPVIVHTLERATEAECFADIVCFTDSEEIGAAVADHGFRYVLTGEAANGTDRIGRNLDSIQTDLVSLRGKQFLSLEQATFSSGYPIVYAAVGSIVDGCFNPVSTDCRPKLPLQFPVDGIANPVLQITDAMGHIAFFSV